MKVYIGLLAIALASAGCAVNSGSEIAQGSDIPGQLDDGGWVMNIPGMPHTHRVVLRECPEQPVTTTHTHDHEQVGHGPHKHNGCFTCPVSPTLASRLLN